MKIPVSVIILTYNEERNIARCIDALHEFGDIIIVDSLSTDHTIDILEKDYRNVRIFNKAFRDFGEQRNWALYNTHPKHDWVLFVDADEFMEDELAIEIRDLVKNPGKVVGAYISGRNYFLGTWLKYSTLFPSYQLRLLRRGAIHYRKEGHGQREITQGECAYLKCSWRHESLSKGVYQWVERHNVYSTEEVEFLISMERKKIIWKDFLSRDKIKRRRNLKILSSKMPFRPYFHFFYTYVLRGGVLDGYAGWLFVQLQLAHYITVSVKVRERKHQLKSCVE